ncbi:MAG: ABC transporter ATP-binding protein [Anaerolineae bacterium]|nr:MAG: ABC transporter ATP-binding protein [Anaerolineae bacterium]
MPATTLPEDDFLVDAQDLRKSFGDVRAVDGVTLRVRAGEIFGLVGSDGAGKTTTLRLLVGALRPDTGRILIGGYDLARDVERARAQIGYLSQRFSLYEDLTVLENIRFFAEVRGIPADRWRPRSMEILEFVGLAEFVNRRAGQLSGGMKQKLGLATALVHRPRVLLLDEPTTGVDPVTRQDFWQLIIRLTTQENVAMVISTPYMDEASRCTRLGFMREGRFMIKGTPSELRAVLRGRVLELRGHPMTALRRIASEDADVEDARAFGDRLHLRVRPGRARAVLRRLPRRIRTQGVVLSEARLIQPTLEDVFIALADGVEVEA